MRAEQNDQIRTPISPREAKGLGVGNVQRCASEIRVYMNQHYNGFTPIVRTAEEWGIPSYADLRFVEAVLEDVRSSSWHVFEYTSDNGDVTWAIAGTESHNAELLQNRLNAAIGVINGLLRANPNGGTWALQVLGIDKHDDRLVEKLIEAYGSAEVGWTVEFLGTSFLHAFSLRFSVD